MMGYWGGYNGYGMGGFGFFSMILTVLFWVLIVALIIRLVKGSGHGRMWHSMGMGKTALDILKERYAKGEIDKKEFDEKKKDLE